MSVGECYLPTVASKKSGNRETNQQILRLPDDTDSDQVIDFKGF